MAKSGPQQVTISLDMLREVATKIEGIDTKISAATGSDAAIRKSIAEGLAATHAETVDGYVNQLADSIAEMPDDVLIGLTSKLESVLKERFDSRIKTFLDAEVTKATAGDKDDLDKLKAERKALVEEFRSVATILKSFGFDTSEVPEPKRRASSGGGGGGAKTAKNKEGYQYSMDGSPRPPSQNSVSSLAFYATVNCEGGQGDPPRWSTSQFKEFLANQGVNWGQDDEWSVTLPNGKVVSARRFTEEELASFEAAANQAAAPAEETHDEAPADETVEA